LQVEKVGTAAEEIRAEGNVSRRIYVKYFTASWNPVVLMVIVLLCITAEVRNVSNHTLLYKMNPRRHCGAVHRSPRVLHLVVDDFRTRSLYLEN